MDFLIFFGVIGVVVALFVVPRYLQAKNWRIVAHELGLRYINEELIHDPELVGTYRGRPLSVKTVYSGGGKHKKAYTDVEVALSALTPRELEVRREGFFQKVGKALGGEDIEVGDPDLDDRFIIKGLDAQEVRDVMTDPEVKRQVIAAKNRYASFAIGAGVVRIRQRGRTINMDKLRGYIRTMVAVGNAIEDVCADQSSSDQPSPKALPDPAAQSEARLPEAKLPANRPANQSAPQIAEPTAEPTAEPVAASDASSNDDDWW